ncbi:MAG: aminopeptidase [bacterium]
MKKSELKKYAKVLVEIGANVQKKQEVIVNAPVEAFLFAEYVVEAAYKKGAKKVTVNWNDSNINKMNYKYQKVDSLCEVQDYDIDKMKKQATILPAVINIGSPNPDAMNGIDMTKVGAVMKAHAAAFKEIRQSMAWKHQSTIGMYPNEVWAKKIFPTLSGKQAVKELWKAISMCSRLDGNPIENWKEHNDNILKNRKMLNDLKIKTLHFTNSIGTDIKIDLLENTGFAGGGLYTPKGVYFYPNVPTEETFTSPDKNSANGIVYSSKPLSVRGSLVDNFGFKFKNGKIVEVLAKDDKHKKILEELINTDEGASRLGEVALVPFSSPINQTNLLFYNTLYDENAVCHLAIGNAFSFTINGNENMTAEEIKAVGLNESMIHVDFMIGTSDMSVVATTYSGEVKQIFKNGEWAI